MDPTSGNYKKVFEKETIELWETEISSKPHEFFQHLAQYISQDFLNLPKIDSDIFRTKCIPFLASNKFMAVYEKNDEEGDIFFLRIAEQSELINSVFCRCISSSIYYARRLLPFQTFIDKNNLLAAAYQASWLEEIPYLEEHSEAIRTGQYPDGYTPLHAAAEYGRVHSIPVLLKCIDPNLQDKFGNTALHYACSKRHLTVIGLLLRHQADLFTTNNQKLTSFDIACKPGFSKVILNVIFEYFEKEIEVFCQTPIPNEAEIKKAVRFILNYTKLIDQLPYKNKISESLVSSSYLLIFFLFDQASLPHSFLGQLTIASGSESTLTRNRECLRAILALTRFASLVLEEPYKKMIQNECTSIQAIIEQAILKIQSELDTKKAKQNLEASLQKREDDTYDDQDIFVVLAVLGLGLRNKNDHVNRWEDSFVNFLGANVNHEKIYAYGLWTGKDLRALGINFSLKKMLNDYDYADEKQKQVIKDSICKILREEFDTLASLPDNVQKNIIKPFHALQICLVDIESGALDGELKESLYKEDRNLKIALLRSFFEQEKEVVVSLLKEKGEKTLELGELQQKYQLTIKDMFQLIKVKATLVQKNSLLEQLKNREL